MKELTTEEKASRYDEAIKRAKAIYQGSYKPDTAATIAETLQNVFPELRESEDERIRKDLLGYLHTLPNHFSHNGSLVTEWIAWLEKQSEQKSIDKIQLGKKYKCIASPRYSTFMVGKTYKPEDKFLCSFMNFCSDCFVSIEDNGQKDPCETCEEPRLNCQNFPCERKKNFGSANKVEPKFHEGDWILIDRACQVKSIDNFGDYAIQYYDSDFRERYVLSKNFCESRFHLWTINDAKDGDVLVTPLTKGCEAGEQIFVFKGINSRDYVDNCIEYYFRICQGVFYENEIGYMGTTSETFYPATKEQRDLLFKKIKDEGYEWDAEQKQLKKIEQKPAEWSEEDERTYKSIMYSFDHNYPLTIQQQEFVKSIRPQKHWKPTEEQMNTMKYLAKYYAKGCDEPTRSIIEGLYEQLKQL